VTLIDVPEPCLVVFIGAAGAGKSTLAARLFSAEQVLSSDAYRRIVSGDEHDQSATIAAFRRLHHDLHVRLAERRTTVVDATNVTAYARRALVRIAVKHEVPAIAIVLDLEPALVQARNATRPGRIVPSDAVSQQLRDLARSLRREELTREGYLAVHHLRTPDDVERLAIRAPTP